jgi:hypothetical protein
MTYFSMVIGTAAAGAVFGILAAYLLAWLMQDGYEGWGGLLGAVLGLAFGYPVGVFIGVIIFRNLLHYSGSLIFGLIGVIAGGILPFVLAEPLGVNNYTGLMWAFIILSSPLLGTIGFNISKKAVSNNPALSDGSNDTIDIDGQP